MGQSPYTQIYAYLTDDQLLRLEDVMKHMGVTLHSDMVSKFLADYELPVRPTSPCHQEGRVCEEVGWHEVDGPGVMYWRGLARVGCTDYD